MDSFKNDIHIWLAARTAEDFYVFGTLVGLAVTLIGLTAWIRRHHLKKYATEMKDRFITLNLNFWGVIMAVAGFIITNGNQWGNLLPFMVTHGPQITVIATTTFAVSKLLKQFFADRKANKPLITGDTNSDGIKDLLPTNTHADPRPKPELLQL